MGLDKAKLAWQGRELWRLQLDKLNQLGARHIFISVRKEQKLHEQVPGPQRDEKWLFDPPDEDLGPIGPIHRALMLAEMPILVLAVDMPLMTTGFMRDHLLQHVGTGMGFVFQTSQGLEPLAALYHPAMVPLITRCVAEGRTGLQSMLHNAIDLGMAICESIPSSEEHYFENINTPDVWEKMKAGC